MAVRLGVPEAVAGVPLARRLAWVTGLRVVLLVVALGAVAALNIVRGFAVASTTVQVVVATLAAAFACASLYAAVLRSGKHLAVLAMTQLVLDQATWTVLVYLTGGATSGATSFYGFTCLLGAFLIGRAGALVAGAAALAFYAVATSALHWGWLSPPADQPSALYFVTGEVLAYHLFVNFLVLLVVSLLGTYLAERLARAGGQIVEAEARAESAERLAALGRLAAGLAHEIRNPLGSISGSIELLRTSSVLSDDERRLCEIIQREAARLNDLVSDMMDVARPRKPEMQTVDLGRLVLEVVELAGTSGRGVSDVAVRYVGDSGALVRADPGQLRQLVWNLVRNAVQASEAGGCVRCRVTALPRTVDLAVEDDGVGIEPEAKARIFDAFFTTRSHGTGIGLAVVKRIADEHGFTLAVESERGRGAVFRVSFQRILPEASPPEPEPPRSS